MIKLIKFTVLLIVLGIFAFSQNPTVSKIRSFTFENGKKAYSFCVGSMETSKYDSIKTIGATIK